MTAAPVKPEASRAAASASTRLWQRLELPDTIHQRSEGSSNLKRPSDVREEETDGLSLNEKSSAYSNVPKPVIPTSEAFC